MPSDVEGRGAGVEGAVTANAQVVEETAHELQSLTGDRFQHVLVRGMLGSEPPMLGRMVVGRPVLSRRDSAAQETHGSSGSIRLAGKLVSTLALTIGKPCSLSARWM